VGTAPCLSFSSGTGSDRPPGCIRRMTTPNEAGAVFGQIYLEDQWDGGSGIGSAPDATAPYRLLLADLLAADDVHTVLDVGCGDWQLGSLVDWSPVRYVGVDAVAHVIEDNRARFGDRGVDFRVVDARRDALPSADVLLVKDVLQHWSNADVEAFLRTNLGRYRYCVLTNDVASTHWSGDVNQDVLLGEWRTLDLEAAPFGRRAAWRADFDVRGEWTKRVALCASPAARATARFRRRSALALIRASRALGV
jgi:SAM-dependent methyltransferase